MEFTIRFAKKSDIDKIMKFIDEFWKKGHILSRDKVLFEWQYGNNDGFNIVIGLDKYDNIQGILGYITYDSSDNKDIALALWKANPSTGFLGLRLLKYLMDKEVYNSIICPGINMKTTSKIYEHVGMKVGTMVQWYRLAKKTNYYIAKVVDNKIPPHIDTENDFNVFEVGSIDELKEFYDFRASSLTPCIPYKSEQYIDKRYFKHPQYRYRIYAITKNGESVNAAIILRIQNSNGSNALRLIDCLGELKYIEFITEDLDRLMEKFDCEYIDVYEAGIDDGLFISAGWTKVDDEGNIIPDYFHPFELKKIDIHYATSDSSAILFKGDGDQDRPN